jgi:hypothetical protein
MDSFSFNCDSFLVGCAYCYTFTPLASLSLLLKESFFPALALLFRSEIFHYFQSEVTPGDRTTASRRLNERKQ